MIRINLLKDSRPHKTGGFNISSDLIKKVGIGSGGILVIIVTVIVIKALIFGVKKDKGIQLIVRDDYNPSTHLSKNVIEETVRDNESYGDKIDKNGVLRLPYKDLAFIEKVNFENHFAKSVIDLLYRNVTSGVDFRGISFSEYKNISGNGRANSRSIINDVFKRLRNDGVTFMPKPHTTITKLEEGYSFVIESAYSPGLNLTSQFKVYKDDFPDYDDVDIIIKRIIDACGEGGLHLSSGPARNNAEVKNDYRRLTYKMTCSGSYRSFANFINKMYQQQIPCSVKSASLKAVKSGSLRINLELMITTKR